MRPLDNSSPFDKDFRHRIEHPTEYQRGELNTGSITGPILRGSIKNSVGRHLPVRGAQGHATRNTTTPSSWDEHPMSTNDPEFYQTPKFSPEQYQAPPRQRGCFFYGCIIASVLALLVVILVAILAFVGYRYANQDG